MYTSNLMWCRLMSIYIPILIKSPSTHAHTSSASALKPHDSRKGERKPHIFRVADGSVAVIPAISFVNFT